MCKVRCNNCMNKYEEEELIFIMEDTSNSETGYMGCPECCTDQYLMDLE